MFKSREKKSAKAKTDFDRMLVEQLNQLEESRVKPVFWNADSKIYCQSTELNGFHSITLLLTGLLKINTIQGCKFTLVAENDTFELMSDSEVVKGDYSDAAQVGVTNFDIDLNDDLIEFIDKNVVTSAKVETKNGQFIKQKLNFEYNNVDLEELKTRMNYYQEEEE